MTPFYDIISVFPVIGKKAGMIHSRKIKMAMAILGESHKTYHWYKMTRSHWINTAKRTGFSVESTKKILDEVLEQAPQVRDKVEQEIPENFPEMVSETILNGMISALEKIA